jgi:hypothetical protein
MAIVSVSLKSLGLSKDPKDAQRRPSCFPDVRVMERSIHMFPASLLFLRLTFSTIKKSEPFFVQPLRPKLSTSELRLEYTDNWPILLHKKRHQPCLIMLRTSNRWKSVGLSLDEADELWKGTKAFGRSQPTSLSAILLVLTTRYIFREVFVQQGIPFEMQRVE